MSTVEVLFIFFHSLAQIHRGNRMGHFRIIHHHLQFTLTLKAVLRRCQHCFGGDDYGVVVAVSRKFLPAEDPWWIDFSHTHKICMHYIRTPTTDLRQVWTA